MLSAKCGRFSMPYCTSDGKSYGRSRLPMVTEMRSTATRLYVSGVPHSRQKSRATAADEWKVPGCPRVQTKSARGTPVKAWEELPDASWHMRHQQMVVCVGADMRA